MPTKAEFKKMTTRAAVEHCLQAQPNITTAEIVDQSGKGKSSVSATLAMMVKAGAVAPGDREGAKGHGYTLTGKEYVAPKYKAKTIKSELQLPIAKKKPKKAAVQVVKKTAVKPVVKGNDSLTGSIDGLVEQIVSQIASQVFLRLERELAAKIATIEIAGK